jgi:Tfp pilus assembly pilus retraction ATPase PilT
MRGEIEVSSGRYTLGYKRSWKQRLRDWLNDSGEEKVRQDIYVDDSPSIDSDKGIRFNVYKASGGTIIETRFYDRQKDRQMNSLHVITDDKDIGKELGKIITMETLRG